MGYVIEQFYTARHVPRILQTELGSARLRDSLKFVEQVHRNRCNSSPEAPLSSVIWGVDD